jgi:membrane-associated phospholipid phosphatase
LYVAAFLLFIHPTAFAGFSAADRRQVMLIIGLNLVFFPLMTVFLLKALGFIESLYLRSQKDRIIPYIASGIFYFWAYTVFRQQSHYPVVLTGFILGAFLSASAALILNIYFKVSMHALGMGGWLGVFLLVAWSNTMMMTWPLALVILLTGIVCTSRLILGAHRPRDMYAGILIAILAQFIAARFLQ